MADVVDLDKAIRKIPDFPKPGILFYDITSILADPKAFSYCIDRMVDMYKGQDITAVACIEARGFLFAAPFAYKMGIPLILARKKGKLPGETYEKRFSLEYGEDVIQIHKSDIKAGERVLIVDDLIATGGTVRAVAEIIEEANAHVADIFCIIGLPFLPYKNELESYHVTTLIEYESE